MKKRLLLSCFMLCLSLASVAFAKNIIKYNFKNIRLDVKDNKILHYSGWRLVWDAEDYIQRNIASIVHSNSINLPLLFAESLPQPIQIVEGNKEIKFFLYKEGSANTIDLSSSACFVTLKASRLSHFYDIKFFGTLHAPGGDKNPFIKNFSCEIKRG